jgi:hypothetical protein
MPTGAIVIKFKMIKRMRRCLKSLSKQFVMPEHGIDERRK